MLLGSQSCQTLQDGSWEFWGRLQGGPAPRLVFSRNPAQTLGPKGPLLPQDSRVGQT